MKKNTTSMKWNAILKGALGVGLIGLATTLAGQETLTIQRCMDLVESQSLPVQKY